MAKLKSVLGYAAAALSIPIMLAASLAHSPLPLGEAFISATGLKTSANWSGGEVVRTIGHGAYETRVHRMVFDALIGERSEGFVQVAWAPLDALPARIDEEIDADGDGQADLRVEVDTANKESTLTPYVSWVLDLEGTYRLNDTLAVRVRLRNPSR
jgi:hypothetical protein